ncbi:hypothetical protein [Kibdelosporangium phytohabitans]|uniref:hypothetical protein n=1 Tax=Kibdelosporangium phytohabitans TaxID=860235 RepID=UPI0012FB9AFC|nr:hypothetical protein [Kibdelosporangium phytohabitans]
MSTAKPVTLPVRVVVDLPMAWRHHCGHLNPGAHHDHSVCAGCSADAPAHTVDARYLLVEYGT